MTHEGHRPISEAVTVAYGTIADLLMPSGRIYRAVWGFRGRCCAWWPTPGQIRRSPIALFDPVSFAVQATGSVPRSDWERAVAVNHASAAPPRILTGS